MPVMAMPSTNCFWKARNTTVTGNMMIAAAAMIAPMSWLCWLEKKLRARGMVMLVGVLR